MFYIYIFLAVLCCIISFSDLRKRIIKNSHVGVVAALAVAIGIADFSLSSIWILGICWSALLFLHVIRVFGGGDVKLIAAFSLSLPNQSLFEALILVGLFGGVVAVAYLVKRQLCQVLGKQNSSKEGLPYGVAICCGFYTALLLKTSV